MLVKSVFKVKSAVEGSIGKKVKFKIKKGKSKSQLDEGIITDTYPAVFTVQVENKGNKRVVSFNYIDLLTDCVEMFLCNEEETRIM